MNFFTRVNDAEAEDLYDGCDVCNHSWGSCDCFLTCDDDEEYPRGMGLNGD